MGVVQAVKKGAGLPQHVRLVRQEYIVMCTRQSNRMRRWLTEFTDSDVVSLICPRPLLVQTGKKDGIAWWPQVIEEFNAAKEHYSKLGLPDRIELDLHDGAHEIRVESGLAFLKTWLMQ
jgi:hypothetical protein